MGARNDFYWIVDQYLRNKPEATAPEAWAHFLGLARDGFIMCIVTADPGDSWIEIVPDAERIRTKRIKRAAFLRRCSFIRRDIFLETS